MRQCKIEIVEGDTMNQVIIETNGKKYRVNIPDHSDGIEVIGEGIIEIRSRTPEHILINQVLF